MTEREKIEFEGLIMKVISIGAFWVYPDEMESYLAVGYKKIQPMTNRGYRVLKGMVRKEFFDKYVLEPMLQ